MGNKCFHALLSSTSNYSSVSDDIALVWEIVSSKSTITLFLYDIAHPECGSETNPNELISIRGTICCDRSNIRSDICVMKGDVRTHSASSSIFLYTSRDENDFVNYGDEEGDEVIQHEKIRPYTRKWEKGTMDTIDELVKKQEAHQVELHE
nr:hypothetical protein CFP56_59532 [Quercus suber]